MELLQSKTEDTGFEKHLPVIEKSENKVTVKVGSIPHPMEEAHYIEFIILVTNKGFHVRHHQILDNHNSKPFYI
jgi:superoxide reductase